MQEHPAASLPGTNPAQSFGGATPVDWMNLIRAEYCEMPGLSLTLHQVERLWSLEAAMAEMLLLELQKQSFLRQTSRGTYVRVDLGTA